MALHAASTIDCVPFVISFDSSLATESDTWTCAGSTCGPACYLLACGMGTHASPLLVNAQVVSSIRTTADGRATRMNQQTEED